MKIIDAACRSPSSARNFGPADVIFSNLECLLYTAPPGHSVSNEGFFADPAIGGEALKRAGISAVGIANNVHYGERRSPLDRALDQLGILP